MNDTSSLERRTLVFAPTGRDARLMASFMERAEKPCHIVNSVSELCQEIQNGAAAAVVTEEGINGTAIDQLRQVLEQQPPWSDFPLILLISGGRVTAESERSRVLRLPLGNVLLLERPLRPETLLSTVEMAVRGRQRQYQIRDQIQQVERAHEALRRSEKLAVTGRLAASIAHEINNPLEAVTNLLYLIRSEACSPQMLHYLDIADQELARVTEISKHTLRFYREPNQPVQINVADVLESVLALYHSRLAAAHVKADKQFFAQSVIVRASVGELRQIIANLVGNALDAMRNGGTLCVRLSVESSPLDPGAKRARITIADNGTGIPAPLLSTIFEPFITTKGETGTGLGLWVSDELIKKNGWSMRVRSSTSPESHGTIFSLLIPLRERQTLHQVDPPTTDRD
ncbi:sensor histidine kinase [Edaphobacter sp. HDX4]|uniref:sensor histidine kinase n=1 Tax=Edaphobacter sp. HDX4 TaxID=2794064 RepID=UPI002FE50C87